MHTIKITRTANSLDQEFEMKNPLVRHEGDYFEIYDADTISKSHKIYVFTLNLLMIEIIPH